MNFEGLLILYKTKADLLTSLRGMTFIGKNQEWWEKNVGRQAVVLLFTPSFAALVENDATFVPDVLKALTNIQPEVEEASTSKEKSHEIDVVCARVDGLSPGEQALLCSDRNPAQDKSLLVWHHKDIYDANPTPYPGKC